MTVLETTVYRAPLGLVLTDPATNAAVADGLVVSAWPVGDPGGARIALHSPISPILVFGSLPRTFVLDDTVTDDPSTLFGSPPQPSLPFLVRVTDTYGRYLPELVSIEVPLAGLVARNLYSAPARPSPSGFACVRGEVASATGGPAAWAVVELTAGATTYTTLTDPVGRWLVYLPYPESLPPLVGSPPSGEPLDQITWTVDASVRYQPAAQVVSPDARAGDPPELDSLLAQSYAAVSGGSGSPSSVSATLAMGVPLLFMIEVTPS